MLGHYPTRRRRRPRSRAFGRGTSGSADRERTDADEAVGMRKYRPQPPSAPIRRHAGGDRQQPTRRCAHPGRAAATAGSGQPVRLRQDHRILSGHGTLWQRHDCPIPATFLTKCCSHDGADQCGASVASAPRSARVPRPTAAAARHAGRGRRSRSRATASRAAAQRAARPPGAPSIVPSHSNAVGTVMPARSASSSAWSGRRRAMMVLRTCARPLDSGCRRRTPRTNRDRADGRVETAEREAVESLSVGGPSAAACSGW